MSADIKDHFLAIPMDKPEHMKTKCKCLPEDIRKRHNQHTKATNNDCICIRIKKGMPELKQVALLAHQHLRNCLKPYGYEPIPGTSGSWKHCSRPTMFCLCVDDFGIKHWSKQDADRPRNAILANFRYTVDKECRNYCGLTLNWNRNKGFVDTSMPKCVPATLKKLMHVPKVRPQHSPHRHVTIVYGKKGQQQIANDTTYPHLLRSKIKRMQSITGSFL